MVDPNTRQGKRTPVTLKIKFKSETLEQFIERYAVDVSQGGIFIRTKEPLAVGTQMKFEFQLRDASPLIAGEGTVVWTRENDPSRPAIAPGMGVRFDRLADGSQGILERILAEKAKQAPQRPAVDTMKPPMFTDTPTRVAPAPMQEALLGPRRNADDAAHGESLTPLPKPMPFHSDADEFPDEAFEEATKVRALDELIAQTADGATAADELAQRRNGRSEESVSERAETLTESAEAAQQRRERTHPTTGKVSVAKPEAYDAPETASRQAKLLDASPSPRLDPGQPAFTQGPRTKPSTPPVGLSAQMLDGPAFASSPAVAPQLPSGALRAVASEQTEPARMPPLKPTSNSPLIILLLVLIAAAGAAVWFFVLRPRATEQSAATGAPPPTEGSAAAGSAVAVAPAPGSAAAAGSAAPTEPVPAAAGSAAAPAKSAALVDAIVSSNAEGARVEVKGTPQAGPAPFAAKLELGRTYKVRVTAHGFAALELDVKGGDEKPFAKLVAKPRIISIVTDPPGALIIVDSVPTGRTTPSEVELTSAQSTKKAVRVQLRKSGFRSIDRSIDVAKFSEDDTKMTLSLDEKLTTAPQASRPAPTPKAPAQPAGDTGSATPDGPVTTPSSEGSSAPPPAPTPPATPAPATPPAEPEPEFNKPQQ